MAAKTKKVAARLDAAVNRVVGEVVGALPPELRSGVAPRLRALARRKRKPALLHSMTAVHRGRVVAVVLGGLIPRWESMGLDLGDGDLWRRFAKQCRVSFVPVFGLVAASASERDAWLTRGGGC